MSKVNKNDIIRRIENHKNSGGKKYMMFDMDEIEIIQFALLNQDISKKAKVHNKAAFDFMIKLLRGDGIDCNKMITGDLKKIYKAQEALRDKIHTGDGSAKLTMVDVNLIINGLSAAIHMIRELKK